MSESLHIHEKSSPPSPGQFSPDHATPRSALTQTSHAGILLKWVLQAAEHEGKARVSQ